VPAFFNEPSAAGTSGQRRSLRQAFHETGAVVRCEFPFERFGGKDQGLVGDLPEI
jgi:hypothetical protein